VSINLTLTRSVTPGSSPPSRVPHTSIVLHRLANRWRDPSLARAFLAYVSCWIQCSTKHVAKRRKHMPRTTTVSGRAGLGLANRFLSRLVMVQMIWSSLRRATENTLHVRTKQILADLVPRRVPCRTPSRGGNTLGRRGPMSIALHPRYCSSTATSETRPNSQP